MPAKELTPIQKADAARLKSKFREWQQARAAAGDPITQEALTERLGFGQSATSQYLNGSIPLNPKAAAKFALLLDVPVADFSPSIAMQIWDMAGSQDAGTLKKVEKITRDVPPPWPFKGIDLGKLSRVKGENIGKMEAALLGAAGALGIDIAAPATANRKSA